MVFTHSEIFILDPEQVTVGNDLIAVDVGYNRSPLGLAEEDVPFILMRPRSRQATGQGRIDGRFQVYVGLLKLRAERMMGKAGAE